MSFNLFEPEETIGALWHKFITSGTGTPAFPEQSATFELLHKRLGIFFRGLGGEPGIEIKAINAISTSYRLNWRERLGNVDTFVQRTRLDGDTLFLPAQIDSLPEAQQNEDLYFWLTAWAAAAGDKVPQIFADPFQNEISYLRYVHQITSATLARFPGLKPRYEKLKAGLLAIRPVRELPPEESWIESCILAMLGAEEPEGEEAAELMRAIQSPEFSSEHWTAPRKYQTHMPVVLWAEAVPRVAREHNEKREDVQAGEGMESEEPEDEKTYNAKRHKSDEADRKDSLILSPFGGIMSWIEMLNINRAVEDEDEDQAKKAADDLEEISLSNTKRKAASRLSFNLNLSPEDIEIERLSGLHLYPEWDYRKNIYYEDYCKVLTSIAPEAPEGEEWQPDAASRRRIRAVKRQFEAIRPKRERLRAQLDGSEFDMDALIRARCDFLAHGQTNDRIYLQTREQARDMAVAVLIDTSRSTESWIEGRQVIDVAREALAAMAQGLAQSGDDYAIYGFSSLMNKRVFISTIKGFDEPPGQRVLSRIGAIKPGFYTRLGAAVRHVSKQLEAQPNEKRLLLVITDGKPNDLDHYESRYGIEDTAKAIREARQVGHIVFGVTIDAKAQDYFPYIFGRGAFSIISHAGKLTQALPVLYRNLVS